MNTVGRFKRRVESNIFWLPLPEKWLFLQPPGKTGGAPILILRLLGLLGVGLSIIADICLERSAVLGLGLQVVTVRVLYMYVTFGVGSAAGTWVRNAPCCVGCAWNCLCLQVCV
jgi:hypothetical protein